jgi:hypothetical protein
MKKNLWMMLLVLTLVSCLGEDGGDDGGGGGGAPVINSEYQGQWKRNDLGSDDCDDNMNVYAGGGGSDSQAAFLDIDGDSIEYAWQVFPGQTDCPYSSSSNYWIDKFVGSVEEISDNGSTQIIKVTITSMSRQVVGSSAVSGLNTNSVCDETDWVATTYAHNNAQLSACDDGDNSADFKFRSITIGFEVYMKFTRSGSALSTEWSTDGGSTYDTAVEYLVK